MKKYLVLFVILSYTLIGYSQPKLSKSVEKHFTKEQVEAYNKACALYRYNIIDTSPAYMEGFLYDYNISILEKAEVNPLLNLISSDIYSILVDYKTDDTKADEANESLIYNDWACVLFRLTKAMNNDFKPYGKECLSLLEESEKMNNQVAAYNIACYYSVKKKEKESLKWLHTMVTKRYTIGLNEISREGIDNETDFDSIRNAPEFRTFLDKYYPKK